MEKHSVSRLIGAPPGYIGYDEGGQLTEAVRRRPYSVILFDEIEKAHNDVFNLFLQILDDGMLTDSRGRTVNFKNTIIIMTSNLGSDILLEQAVKKDRSEESVRETIHSLLRQNFRPEFLNRIDEILLFHGLSQKDIEQILEIQMSRLSGRLGEMGIALELCPDAKSLLAERGYDPEFGARPLKRTLVRDVETPVSRMLIAGDLSAGTTLKISTSGKELKFSVI
jgi:ATP-dependent Clp protease ATP-binding subunit ClpB